MPVRAKVLKVLTKPTLTLEHENNESLHLLFYLNAGLFTLSSIILFLSSLHVGQGDSLGH
jgi:hypothetical protein